MRKIFAILLTAFTIVLICVLDRQMGSLPPLGRLLDPVNGCWANAEPLSKDYNFDYKFSALKSTATVWFDDRLVPHIHAANDHDLFYLQGFYHATFRLWQMDMQTRAAAGAVSEVIGEKGLNYDRKQRRKGMLFAAANSLKMMEADPVTKAMMDAYTDGVNAYIAGLKYRDYPIEYKLMNFVPEKWNNLKIAVLMKFMADDLTGYTEDIPLTYLRDILTPQQFDLFYPEKILSSATVIPSGTEFEEPSLEKAIVPAKPVFPKFSPVPASLSALLKHNEPTFLDKNEEKDGIGSNNWAVGGARTKSGAAILCNDPHLGLNLPSLWFEVQLQTPGFNVYGVSLPGAPGVVIGFNDSVAWGFTNNYRDVKDFYSIRTVAENPKNKYWFNERQVDFERKMETIKIKNRPDYIDTVNYTVHGPVMYDNSFMAPGGYDKPLAVCWMAHRPSNELKSLYQLNHAKNYDEYVNAISSYICPAQNMLFADRKGNIAIWGQGQFVNKWNGQGKFIMTGDDSVTLWKELIPVKENPHVYNPAQGFISSANECVTDSTYPYWYNGFFSEFRAWRIHSVLSNLQQATIEDMFKLQNDNFSILAANALPVMLTGLSYKLTSSEQKYAEILRGWNFNLDAESTAASAFQIWWYYLYVDLWGKMFKNVPESLYPSPERTLQMLRLGLTATVDNGNVKLIIPESLRQGGSVFAEKEGKINIDSMNIGIIGQNYLPHNIFEYSFKEATDSLAKFEKTGTKWYEVKNTSVRHLAKLAPFSFDKLKIGGWGNTVNAAKIDHGPSWRMVIEMGNEINAYGVYPGGQNGNPGSKFYATFLPYWVEGKYYKLLFLPNTEQQSANNIKYTTTVHP